ncbi:MAG: hypothetical protein NVS3B20_03970 [Polyangiales bacterium]
MSFIPPLIANAMAGSALAMRPAQIIPFVDEAERTVVLAVTDMHIPLMREPRGISRTLATVMPPGYEGGTTNTDRAD